MKPTTSATPSKCKISGGPKKVAHKNSERSVRSKRSTTESQPPALQRALQRATDIQAKLSNEHPSFIKTMLHSHVNQGFWLGVPKPFCDLHMPKEDTMFLLEDEDGEEFRTKYLDRKMGLSGKWKEFSKAHHLRLHDVLVFQLVQPSKFKVYIIQSNEPDKVDDSSRQHDSDVAQQNDPSSSRMICDSTAPSADQPENTSNDPEENSGLQVLNGRSMTTCQQVTSVDTFSIVVDGLVLDSLLPQHLRMKYYDLCCSQQSFLHEHILAGQNRELVLGMIRETINIADAIRGSKITTPSHSFDLWFRKLKALEIWGMNVSFLLVRLQQLRGLASKAEEYREARRAREQALEQKKGLQLRLKEVKETIRRLDGQVDSLNPKTLEATFEGLANAAW